MCVLVLDAHADRLSSNDARKRISSLFQLQDDAWKQHANPVSVWSRTTVLPALIFGIWSRIWIGWWAVIPILLALLWTALNPHIFGVPAAFDSWASTSVLGERLWAHREETPVPEHHRVAPQILNAVSASGMLFVAWGVVKLAIWPTLVGTAFVYAGTLWFLDRMVWLYEDMETTPHE